MNRFYVPDFIPTISPVKKGVLINSHLSRNMKTDLDRELVTRQLEFEALQKIKQEEREYIVKFNEYMKNRHNSGSVRMIGTKLCRHSGLPPIRKKKSQSPYVKKLIEIDYYTLKGNGIISKKSLTPKQLRPTMSQCTQMLNNPNIQFN